jgi:hypothetical protein
LKGPVIKSWVQDARILVSRASINRRLILQRSRSCYGNRFERRIYECKDVNHSAFFLTETIDQWKSMTRFIVWGCFPSESCRGVKMTNTNLLKDEL